MLVLGLFLYQDYLEGGVAETEGWTQPQFLFDSVGLGCGPILCILHVVYAWVPVHVVARSQGFFLYCFLPYILREDLSLSLSLSDFC